MELPNAIDQESFAWLDLLGLDRWNVFTPSPTSLTVVGTPTYTGRWRILGRMVEFQISMVSTTSVASTAGTTYFTLPVLPAKGIAGEGSMTNATSKVAVGLCHIDITNSRCYLPAQAASGSTFSIFGRYEV